MRETYRARLIWETLRSPSRLWRATYTHLTIAKFKWSGSRLVFEMGRQSLLSPDRAGTASEALWRSCFLLKFLCLWFSFFISYGSWRTLFYTLWQLSGTISVLSLCSRGQAALPLIIIIFQMLHHHYCDKNIVSLALFFQILCEGKSGLMMQARC